jgi:serine/threonine-protein kinase RsbT
MTVARTEKLPVQTSEDIVKVRQAVRAWAVQLGFSLVDQTKIVTAASELARNTVIYGGGGTVELESLLEPRRRGLRLTFADQGAGIANTEQALKDGFTTGNGLGLGLGGAGSRLRVDLELVGQPLGTTVRITRWT